jgi:hypothetical protein
MRQLTPTLAAGQFFGNEYVGLIDFAAGFQARAALPVASMTDEQIASLWQETLNLPLELCRIGNFENSPVHIFARALLSQSSESRVMESRIHAEAMEEAAQICDAEASIEGIG